MKNNSQPEVPLVKICDFEIKEVTETKFLGVTIDNELSWVPHLTSLAKKLTGLFHARNSDKILLGNPTSVGLLLRIWGIPREFSGFKTPTTGTRISSSQSFNYPEI